MDRMERSARKPGPIRDSSKNAYHDRSSYPPRRALDELRDSQEQFKGRPQEPSRGVQRAQQGMSQDVFRGMPQGAPRRRGQENPHQQPRRTSQGTAQDLSCGRPPGVSRAGVSQTPQEIPNTSRKASPKVPQGMPNKASSGVQPIILPPKSRGAKRAVGAAELITAEQKPSARRVRLSTLPWFSARVLVTFGVALLALAGFIAYQTLTVSVVKIVSKEKQFGYTASYDDAKDIVYNAVHILGEQKDDNANVMTDEKFTYVSLRIDKKTFEENKASADDIAQYVKTYIPGYGIKVNDEVVIVLPTQEDAEEILEELKEHYAARSDTNIVSSVEYLESVSIVEEKAQPLSMKTKDEAKKALTEGRFRAREHQVVEGDTLQDIAREYNTTLDAIASENPGLVLDGDEDLVEGTILKVVEEKPYLTVVVKGERFTTEDIPFETEKKKVAQNTTVVHQEGELGARDVRYKYTSKNGVLDEEDKEIITETIKKEPVTKIIYEGTGYKAGSKIAQGSGTIPKIRWPVDTGSITSGFRTAQRPNHTGIDVGLAVGNPCYAAAGGVVIASGWGGGYGWNVVIDHGDGVGTRYAHLNKMHVAVGETVTRGQKIADTGNSGNSTGPHLHFEIFTNTDGTVRFVNPANYK